MKAVVITGSRSGMGAAVAGQSVRDGYQVIGVDLSWKDAEIGDDPSTAVGRQPMMEQTLDAFVSNAGVDNLDPIR